MRAARTMNTVPFSLLVAALLFVSTDAHAALVTVGSNPETCDYTSLAFAFAFADSGDTIAIEGKTWTHISDVNFNIFDKGLIIVGGYDANCSDTKIGKPATLRGLGDGPVLEIRSSDFAWVTLGGLVIDGGTNMSGEGGGLHVSGNATVVIREVRVEDNSALHGAGIYLDGSEGAGMTLTVGTRLLRNDAEGDGGGLLCTGGADLAINGDVHAQLNTASNGAGLHLGDCNVTIDGGADSPTGPISIQSNTASMAGGGLFVGPGGELNADGGPQGDLLIVANEAQSGGAVALSGGPTAARMSRTLMFGNMADEGAAISNVSAAFYLQPPPDDDCSIYPCSLVSSNGGLTTDGGVFRVEEGHISLLSAGLKNNLGSPAIGSLHGFSTLTLEGSEVTGNVGSAGSDGLTIAGDSLAAFLGVTFGDQESMDRLVSGTGLVNADAIIAAGVPSDLFDPQLNWDLDCAVLTKALPGGPFPGVTNVLVTSDPGFTERDEGVYLLRSDSPAIDLCGDLGPGLDIEGEERPQGLGWDAGSDETETPIFVDGFESGDTSTWSSTT